MAIKDWHEDDRPREKLLKFGAAHLSDAEILAIFLRTGTQSQSAIELARHLIDQFGSLAELLEVFILHGEYPQLLAAAQHGGQPDFALGALLILQDRVEHDGDLFGRRAGQLGGNFNAVDGHSHDLICRFS